MGYYDEVISMILMAKTKAREASNNQYSTEERIRIEYQEALRNNPDIRRYRTEAQEWQDAADKAANELFVPGVIVHSGGNYYVVDGVYSGGLTVYPITYPPTRSRRTNSLYIQIGLSIVTLADIPDENIRRVAEKLVVRVRTRDWKIGEGE